MKFSELSPDFTTLWNYRREIFESLWKTSGDPKAIYEMIMKELKFLIGAIKDSPKSYTLWFHRQWIIQKGMHLESQMASDQKMIFKLEFGLCDKMLQMDERNFHCWNYRQWLVDLMIEQFDNYLDDEEKLNQEVRLGIEKVKAE